MIVKFILFLNRILLNILSYVAPSVAAKTALNIFSKVRIKRIKNKEKPFYNQARAFEVERENENITCYELGNPEGKLLFLIHGWESNPGCFTKFIPHLEKYRIISFTLPGHAQNKEKSSNLYLCKDAFKQVLNYINPQTPFHVVAHSLGSSVTSFALSETKYEVDKLVFLSTNNRIEEVFRDFQKLVGFNERVYQLLDKRIEEMVGDSLSAMRVEDKLGKINFNELLLIHDKNDKIIRFQNSVDLHEKFKNSKLIPFENIGHYRMLWNEEVLQQVLNF